MGTITQYLDLTVQALAHVVAPLGKSDFQQKIHSLIKIAVQVTRDFDSDVLSIPSPLKDALIELRTSLSDYQSILPAFKTDFVEARKKYKELCLRPFRDALVEASWTKFKNFNLLLKIAA